MVFVFSISTNSNWLAQSLRAFISSGIVSLYLVVWMRSISTHSQKKTYWSTRVVHVYVNHKSPTWMYDIIVNSFVIMFSNNNKLYFPDCVLWIDSFFQAENVNHIHSLYMVLRPKNFLLVHSYLKRFTIWLLNSSDKGFSILQPKMILTNCKGNSLWVRTLMRINKLSIYLVFTLKSTEITPWICIQGITSVSNLYMNIIIIYIPYIKWVSRPKE